MQINNGRPERKKGAIILIGTLLLASVFRAVNPCLASCRAPSLLSAYQGHPRYSFHEQEIHETYYGRISEIRYKKNS